MTLDFGQQVEAFRGDRLFAPGRLEPFEPADHGGRRSRGEPTVKLDHQADAGPTASRTAATMSTACIGFWRIERLPGGPERVELSAR